MKDENELLSLLALKEVDGIGGVHCRQILSHLGSAKAFFESPKAKLLKIPGIGPSTLESMKAKTELFDAAAKHLELIRKNEIELCVIGQETYPNRLKNLYDAPPILYKKGTADINNPRTVGIVGTRKATNYGKGVCEEIVKSLSDMKVNVVSGLAYGVDITAHKAALEQGLPTTAVMAGGIGKVYPAAHRKYVPEILQNGLLISENHFNNVPVPAQFVARNRIIAGLSDVVIIVESAAQGGGLITAQFANNYHREVFAVPGRVEDTYSEGPNNLIKSHQAHIFTSVEDLLEVVSWDLDHHPNFKERKRLEIDLSQFTEEETLVISLLKEKGAYLIDDISFETHIPLNRLASLLLNLEFQDMVKALPGKKFELK